MPHTCRKVLAIGLVVFYGGIALLGHGLHELSGHQHHGAESCATHSHAHHGHNHYAGHAHYCAGHGHYATSTPVGPSVDHAHECEICKFLAQLRGEMPRLAVEIAWQYAVAEVAISVPRLESQALLGLHAPRGPPSLAS